MAPLTMALAIWQVVLSVWAAEATQKFPLLMPKVHPEKKEAYLCTPVRVADLEVGFFVTGFEPNSTQDIAHHILIYGCKEPGAMDSVWDCGEMNNNNGYQPCSTKPQIIYAWAKDAPPLHLPDGVGFRVGGHSDIDFLVLQVHYASIDNIPADGDDSGVILEFTQEEQPKVAGVLLLGTGGMASPHTTTFFETACEIEDPRDIHPFAFRVHTHSLGKVVSGYKVHNRSNWELIGKRDPQKPQMFYPVNDSSMTITKGDVLAARCTMVNTHDHDVLIGTTNEDEMCNFYLMYWVDGGMPITPNTCFSQGPPFWSWGGWVNGAALQHIPDEEASTL